MPLDLPPGAVQHLPTLAAEIRQHWPTVPLKSVFAARVEQETCPSLKHKKCWSPYAELKTEREYGFGLGQITITSRFDNFKEAKKLHSSLEKWEWESRYRADYQLRTLVLTDKLNYSKLSWAANPYEQQAMTSAAYNGGLGGLLGERKLCAMAEGCDPTKWFGNIEYHSKKSKVKYQGYGKSFFEINREYVVNSMVVRRPRYAPYFGEK